MCCRLVVHQEHPEVRIDTHHRRRVRRRLRAAPSRWGRPRRTSTGQLRAFLEHMQPAGGRGNLLTLVRFNGSAALRDGSDVSSE